MRLPAILLTCCLVTACAAPTSGCSTIGKIAGPAPIVSSDVKWDDQALSVAYAAGIGANKFATSLAKHGVLVKGSPTAKTVSMRLDQYDLFVKDAEHLKGVGDAKGAMVRLDAAKALLTQINATLEAL